MHASTTKILPKFKLHAQHNFCKQLKISENCMRCSNQKRYPKHLHKKAFYQNNVRYRLKWSFWDFWGSDAQCRAEVGKLATM